MHERTTRFLLLSILPAGAACRELMRRPESMISRLHRFLTAPGTDRIWIAFEESNRETACKPGYLFPETAAFSAREPLAHNLSVEQ